MIIVSAERSEFMLIQNETMDLTIIPLTDNRLN